MSMLSFYWILSINSIFSILAITCNQSSVVKDRLIKQIEKQDSVSKEIPLNAQGKPIYSYQISKKKAQMLGLDSLEVGYDSIQIRIWFVYGMMEDQHVLSIKNSSQHWSAELITFSFEKGYDDKKEIVKRKNVQSILPKSGWSEFLKQLFNLKITTLPNMDNIPGIQWGGGDLTSFNFEIATENNYRFYSYESPKTYQDKFWQDKNVEEILKLIENELNFKRLQS